MVTSVSSRESSAPKWSQLRVDDDQIRARDHGGSSPEVDREIDRVSTAAVARGIGYGLAGGLPVAILLPLLVVWLLRIIGGQ